MRKLNTIFICILIAAIGIVTYFWVGGDSGEKPVKPLINRNVLKPITSYKSYKEFEKWITSFDSLEDFQADYKSRCKTLGYEIKRLKDLEGLAFADFWSAEHKDYFKKLNKIRITDPEQLTVVILKGGEMMNYAVYAYSNAAIEKRVLTNEENLIINALMFEVETLLKKKSA